MRYKTNGKILSVLLAGTFLSTSALAADNIYSIEEGTSSDYNFTRQETDSEGNLTTKYYKIALNPAEFSTSSSITWEPAEAAGENTIEVQLPNNQT